MKNVFLFVFYTCLLQNSCRQKPENSYTFDPNAPKVITVQGHVIPEDSTLPPEVITASHVKSLPAGKPIVIPIINNVLPAGLPNVSMAGKPSIITPGQDTFKLPPVELAIATTNFTGTPEVVAAKEASVKDDDPDNFSSYKILQGLRQPLIRCMIQDRSGNLWFGTYSGGVSKYDGKFFTNYTTAQGLSNDGVWSMLQDRNGNIWFGTYGGGVSMYDGKLFTSYRIAGQLNKNVVVSILEDNDGNIWFGTNNGVTKFNTGKNGTGGNGYTHYTTSEGLCNNFVHCMVQDQSGNLWFGTSHGVSRFDGKSFANYNSAQGLENDSVLSAFRDKNGNLWFGTNAGVTKYDGKSFSCYSSIRSLINDAVNCILEDRTSNLWFGTNGGIIKYDPGKNGTAGGSFTQYGTAQGLSNNKVTSILEDKAGNLWFGTNGGGAVRYDGRTFTHFTTGQGLCYNAIMHIVEDKNGNLWFSSWGGGVSKYDPGIDRAGRKTFSNYTVNQGLSKNNVFTILQDKKENFWFGTGRGVSKFDGKTFTNYAAEQGLCNEEVWSIYEDKKGNLWFGTFGEGVYKFDGNSFTHYTSRQGLSNGIVMCMLEDRKGNFWFGTYGGGVCKFDGKSFTHFTSEQGFSSNEVMDILEDKKGNIWIGTIGGGVNKYDGHTFTNYSTAEGLSNEIVMGILEDKKGNLWFSTRNGLNRMLQQDSSTTGKNSGKTKLTSGLLFKNYMPADGFLGVNSYVNSILQDSKGNIWTGTGDRLTCYHPEGEIPDTIPPNIQISNIALFNENINWINLEKKKDTTLILGNGVHVGNFRFDSLSRWNSIPENLSLAYNNNYLTIKFIGITTRSPYKVRYQYKLDGIDENWSAVTERTEAPYGNLPHGSYTFHVKAMNSEGYWSNELFYRFIIRPPWWKTWWAYGSYFFAIAGSIGFYIKWRERSLIERQKILEQIVVERTAEVVAEKKEVEIQKKRSDELLLNILPSEVAEELKQKGHADAKQFNEVTVMFTDFKGFTQLSEKLSPEELVAEIHTCFKAFDQIITKYNIEKIKTIGDSYMCAGGLPVANTTHATDVVNAAMEIQKLMQAPPNFPEGEEFVSTNGLRDGEVSPSGRFRGAVRIGIHTGPVVAGIVGIKKFAYDIWGDTVNIASRMESSGEAGKVNISGSTYAIVKEKYHCIHRGKIQAKNKGEIDMYFVDSIA